MLSLSLYRSLIILDRSQFRGNHNYGLGSKHISSFFACLMVSCVQRMSLHDGQFSIELNIFFVPLFLVCPSSSFECPQHEKLYRVSRLHDSLSLWLRDCRTSETFLVQSFLMKIRWKKGTHDDHPSRQLSSRMPLGDERRQCDTPRHHRCYTEREREKGGIDKLMGITNAVRVPTQYVKEKKNCRLFFLFRVYVFIFIFLAFNLEKKVIFIHIHIVCVCVCCNHVLERWIPGVIFFFPLRTQVDVVVYDHVGSDLCLSNCSSLIPTPYISFSKK